MIIYNSKTINDWNFDTSNLIKVYRNNAICYYKVSGGGDVPTAQTPCYAVVTDITQYQDTEFVDVYNKADESWYKLNNLNQYEKYGVYGSGRTICQPQPSRLPDGYTEVEYIENSGTTSSTCAFINLGIALYDQADNTFTVVSRLKSEYYSASGDDTMETIINSEGISSPYNGFVYRYKYNTGGQQLELAGNNNNATLTTVENEDGSRTVTIQSVSAATFTAQTPLGLFASYNGSYTNPYRPSKTKIYSCQVTLNNVLMRDLVPAKRDSDSKYGLYDLVTDTFYISPNGNNFVGGETPTQQCVTVYEGKLTIDDGYEYMYSGNSWVNLGEISGTSASLPDVPFVLNYNARDYDASTHTIPYTQGALNEIDAVITGTTANIIDNHEDGYIQLTGSTSTAIRALVGTTNFSRSPLNPNITIICKAYTPGSSNEGNILSNRNESYNWMYRHKSTQLRFHGNSEQGSIAVSNTEPNTCSVRIDSSRLLRYDNWTQNTTSTYNSFSYGSNSNGGALFAGYYSNSGEFWKGVFYWIYMSLNTLTDEEVQQVIDFNEASTIAVYPLYYEVIQEPPTEVSFDTMDEALAYDCPYVGLIAMIDGRVYMFNDQYEWEQLAFTITGTTTSSDPFSLKLNLEDAAVTVYKDNGDGTYDWGVYYTTPITNTSGLCSGNTSLRSFDWGDSDTSGVTTLGNYSFYNCSGLTTMPPIPSNVTAIGDYAFRGCSGISASTITIPEGITTIGNYSFYGFFRNGQKSLNIPSTLTTIGNYAFSNSNQTVNVYIDSLEHWLNLSLENSDSNPIRSQGWLYINGNGIQDVTIPNNISQIKQYAFDDYKHLNSLTIPSNVTSIGQNAFYGVSPITSVTIQNSVTSIGNNAFYASSLKNVVYNSSAYSNNTFTSCSSLSSVTLSNITRIGSSMFQYCYALSSITIPSSVTYIDSYAFRSCTALSSVDIPSSVTTIGGNTFNGCTSLASVTVEATTPPSLGTNVFQGCTALSKIYVPCQSVSTYRSASNWSTYADKIVGYEECTTYEWQTISSAYTCYEGDKYEKQQKMRSFDSGTTWEAVVPAEYQRGQLIESGSTDCEVQFYEYIRTENNSNGMYTLNTNYYLSMSDTIEVSFEMVDTSVDWGVILGWSNCDGDSCDNTQFRFTTVTSNYAIIGRKGNTGNVQYQNIGPNKPLVVNLPISSSTFTWSSGGTYYSLNFNVGTFNLPSTTPMHIFGLGNSQGKKAAVIKLFYVKVFDANNNLVKHYLPSDFNGTPCLYELINGDYILDTYTGSNHGTLTLGPAVN